MTFNILDEAMTVREDGLFLVVLGASGVGKSHFIGTHPGKTLLLYGAGESHGPSSALKSSKNLIPVMWNRAKKEGKVVDLTPDQILPRINAILDPVALKAAGIECIALDSITNLCLDLKKTTLFKQRCTSARGQHNPFKETEALIEILSGIIAKLQSLFDYHGIDSITTMDLSITSISGDGHILESKPGLPTFGVGKAVIQQFADILVLNRRGGNEPEFENMSQVVSKSTDMETKEIVKYVEYHPRLRGVSKLPETIAASVEAINKLKG
jgi:hypothetical protein